MIVQTGQGVRLVRLPSAGSSLYRPLLVALAERGLIESGWGKVFDGTGEPEQLILKIDLDSPRRVAADFGIPDERLVVPMAVLPEADRTL